MKIDTFEICFKVHIQKASPADTQKSEHFIEQEHSAYG